MAGISSSLRNPLQSLRKQSAPAQPRGPRPPAARRPPYVYMPRAPRQTSQAAPVAPEHIPCTKKVSGGTRQEVLKARFGDAARQALLDKAYGLQEAIEAKVVGQGDLAKALQDRVVQFIEEYGVRRKAPLALHVIGLPGVGKSAALELLKETGIQVIRIDAHLFGGANSVYEVLGQLSQVLPYGEQPVPRIIFIDELDKVPEVDGSATGKSHPFMGMVNQLLTDGKIGLHDSYTMDLSNTLVVTAMNFSPRELETFAPEVLGGAKSFYDYSIDDLAAFDAWIRAKPASRAKVLASIFRSNTVSRMAPNALIVRPLSRDDYRTIIQRNVQQTLAAASQGDAEAKKVTASCSGSFIDFLLERIVYAPSGARETVVKAQQMTQQLLNFAARAPGKDPASLVQPRQVRLDADLAAGCAKVRVVATKWYENARVVSDAFSFAVDYDANLQAFKQPDNLALQPPMRRTQELTLPDKPPTRKQILAARFPLSKSEVAGLADKIDTQLIGQKRYTQLIEKDLNAYMARPGPVAKSPPFRIIAGFPGIGKSALVELAGHHAALPVARLNLQAYSGTDAQTMAAFVSDLRHALERAATEAKNGKFILLLEELDKVFEVNPQTGRFVERPVMNYVKDLLNDGFIRTTVSDNGHTREQLVDIRGAYNMVTMNFAVDRFSFSADPRLTTIEDVTRAWKRLQKPAELKEILGSMFLPETVSRLLPRFLVMQPLQRSGYETIITNQVEQVLAGRFFDPATHKNMGQVEVELTPAYRDYLYAEAVIPSEGARNTVVVTQQRLHMDLEEVTQSLAHNDALASVPVRITLDYDPATTEVSATAVARDASAPASCEIYRRGIELTFPPLSAVAPLSEKRLLVAVHEFGHMLTGVRLGKRFEHVVTVSPQAGVGGFVKFHNHANAARDLIGDIYVALGSRAMERIFLSRNPQAPESVLDITAGASGDIDQATRMIWKVLYEFGLDPHGGPIERSGYPYASFAALSEETVRKLQEVLRGMENYLVEQLSSANSKLWHADRVVQLALAGGMSEKEAYAMLGYRHPGDQGAEHLSLAPNLRLHETFKDVIAPYPAELRDAMAFEQGISRTTAGQNLDHAVEHFASLVRQHLHNS